MSLVRSLFSLLKVDRKSWKAIFLSMFAATIFWFFNALNKQYTTNIDFPLVFEFDEKYYVPVEPLPRSIPLNVSGLGWDLLRRSTGFNIPPLVIPLEHPADVRKIVGSSLPLLLSDQLQALQINYVVVDTLNIHFEQKISRWLTLSADSLVSSIDHEYGIVGEAEIVPDSILLEGPIKTISNLTEPFPFSLSMRNINRPMDQLVEVPLPNNGLVIKIPDHVRVRMNVERFVEVSDSVQLSLTNTPSAAHIRLARQEVLIRLRMRESLAKAFPWDSIHARADLKDLPRGKSSLQPELINLPEEVTLLSIDSLHITY